MTMLFYLMEQIGQQTDSDSFIINILHKTAHSK